MWRSGGVVTYELLHKPFPLCWGSRRNEGVFHCLGRSPFRGRWRRERQAANISMAQVSIARHRYGTGRHRLIFCYEKPARLLHHCVRPTAEEHRVHERTDRNPRPDAHGRAPPGALAPTDVISLKRADCVSITGTSGSGKSVFLRALALSMPSSGGRSCGTASRSATPRFPTTAAISATCPNARADRRYGGRQPAVSLQPQDPASTPFRAGGCHRAAGPRPQVAWTSWRMPVTYRAGRPR